MEEKKKLYLFIEFFRVCLCSFHQKEKISIKLVVRLPYDGCKRGRGIKREDGERLLSVGTNRRRTVLRGC